MFYVNILYTQRFLYVREQVLLYNMGLNQNKMQSALHNYFITFELTYCDGGAIFSDTTGKNDGYAALCK